MLLNSQYLPDESDHLISHKPMIGPSSAAACGIAAQM